LVGPKYGAKTRRQNIGNPRNGGYDALMRDAGFGQPVQVLHIACQVLFEIERGNTADPAEDPFAVQSFNGSEAVDTDQLWNVTRPGFGDAVQIQHPTITGHLSRHNSSVMARSPFAPAISSIKLRIANIFSVEFGAFRLAKIDDCHAAAIRQRVQCAASFANTRRFINSAFAVKPSRSSSNSRRSVSRSGSGSGNITAKTLTSPDR